MFGGRMFHHIQQGNMGDRQTDPVDNAIKQLKKRASLKQIGSQSKKHCAVDNSARSLYWKEYKKRTLDAIKRK
jgi:ribosomal protein S21